MIIQNWVIKGLYLTILAIGALDGSTKQRFWRISRGILESGRQRFWIFHLFCLILLSTLVPPCSLNMATQKKGQRAPSEADAWQCEGCKKTFVDKNSRLLVCEYCDNVYCIECLQLTATAYNVCKKTNLHWFCPNCEDKVMKNIRSDREIEERCAEFLQKIEGRVGALESQITTKVDEKQVREIVENMSTEGQAKESHGQSQETVLATVKDCRDSINRESNFIMFRVEELDSDEPLEQKENDVKFVNDFLYCIDAREVEVANVTRIGARSKNKNEKKDRPIKVTCKSAEQKREVMRKVVNLKFITEGSVHERFKKVSVSHDMSKAERQVNKQKLTEAKLKTANESQEGKFIYKVRGPPWNRRTVKLRVREDTLEEGVEAD